MFAKTINFGKTKPFQLTPGIYDIIVDAEIVAQLPTVPIAGGVPQLGVQEYEMLGLGEAKVRAVWKIIHAQAGTWNISETIASKGAITRNIGTITSVAPGDITYISTKPELTQYFARSQSGIICHMTLSGHIVDLRPAKIDFAITVMLVDANGAEQVGMTGEVNGQLFLKLTRIPCEIEGIPSTLTHLQRIVIRKKVTIRLQEWAEDMTRDYVQFGVIQIRQVV